MANEILLQLRLVTTADEIKRAIIDRYVTDLNRRLNTGTLRSILRTETRRILRDAIEVQPEYDSLVTLGAKLNTELGVVDADMKMREIINIWLNGVNVSFTPVHAVGYGVSGRIVITAVPGDFSDVLSSGAASYLTDKGTNIPWLRWLLLQGDAIIIATHRNVFDPAKVVYSRTAGDIMLPTRGAGWRVPPEFSGTIGNNFVTRAVVMALPDVGAMLRTQIRSRL